MESRPPPSRLGFTLIEVVAALVIFALGVLMVIQTSGALSRQMEFSARTSSLVVLTHEWLDSLQATPFDSLTEGTFSDTSTVNGLLYQGTAQLSLVTPALMRIEVHLSPEDSASIMPSYGATSYRSAPW